MTDNIVIELVAMRYSRQPGTRETAKWVEIKTIEALNGKVRTTEAKDEKPHFAALMRKLSSK